MQVNPNETIHLAYNIADPTDTTTYFPKAVMRDSATSATLGSVNLAQDANNHRRYTGNIQAPSMTGNGRYIDIILTVYTDSGHTTVSPVYEEILWNYIVAYRWNQALGGAGSGDPFAGSDFRSSIFVGFEALIKKHLKQKTMKVTHAKTKIVTPDIDPMKQELISAVTKSIRNLDLEKDQEVSTDQIDAITSAVVAAVNDLSNPDIAEVKRILAELSEKVKLIWETEYLEKMRGDGSLLPPERPQEPRSASPGIMPIHQVYENHRMRQAGLLDAAPTPPVPASPDGNPILGEPEINPAARKPSPGVVPTHVIARTKAALDEKLTH